MREALIKVSRVGLKVASLALWQHDRASFEVGMNLHPAYCVLLVEKVGESADVIHAAGYVHTDLVLMFIYKVACLAAVQY